VEKIKVAIVAFSFANAKMIELLSERGEIIKNE
jgi:hypothetical protein